MAFDLNKNEGKKRKFDLSKSKKLLPKFDLTKEKSELSLKGREKKKIFLQIFSLVGVMVFAMGIWYFITQNKHTDKISPIANYPDSVKSSPIELVNNPSPPITGHDSIVNSENNPNTNFTVASLKNKTLANFDLASTALNSIDEKIINNIINYLSKNSNSKLTVYGYASSEGNLTFNQSLSQQRATVFKNFLVDKGIPSDRILVVGKGIENPICSNDTEEGRMKNRRVETVLH